MNSLNLRDRDDRMVDLSVVFIPLVINHRLGYLIELNAPHARRSTDPYLNVMYVVPWE